MVTAGAAQFRDAFIGWQLLRHDRQIVLLNLERARAEEVYVYNNTLDQPLRVVPLPHRKAELQLNMKAEDETGRRLVLLPSAEIDVFYAELFPDVIRALRSDPTLPPPLRTAISDSHWRTSLFEKDWSRNLGNAEKGAIVEYFQQALSTHSDPPNAAEAATQVFADYVIGRLFGFYTPWVLLPDPIEPRERNEIEPHLMIKYIAESGTPYETMDHLWAALGWPLRLGAAFPLLPGASSHGRLKLPDGLVFQRDIAQPQHATRGSTGREQVQLYASPSEIEEVYARRELPAMIVQTRVSQSPAAKLLACAFIALIALLPLVFIEMRLLTDATGRLLPWKEISATFQWGNVLPTFGRVQASDVVNASAVALPIALGLLSAAWTTSNLRPFATAHVVLAAMMLIGWLLAPVAPLVGVIVVAFGLVAALWHAFMATRSQPQPSVTWRES